LDCGVRAAEEADARAETDAEGDVHDAVVDSR
jgi:hypothetical protein